MTIKSRFQPKQVQQVENYEAVDTATGAAYKRYFGCAFSELASYALISTQIDSDTARTLKTSDANVDFDLVFEKTNTIRGDLLVSYTTDTGATTNCMPTVIISHVSATGTETELAPGASGQVLTSGDETARNAHIFRIPATVFIKNERLRVSFDIGGGAGAGGWALYHDPNNRMSSRSNESVTSATSDSTLIVDIPFKQKL